MTKKKLNIVWAIVAVAALAGGFFWGKSMAASSMANRTGRGAFSSSTAGTGFAGPRGGAPGAGGGFTAGQIISLSGDSMTVQLANGNSVNIFYSSSTQVIIPEPAPVSSLKTGSNVIIIGTKNSDGSMTASSIQVRNGSSTLGLGG